MSEVCRAKVSNVSLGEVDGEADEIKGGLRVINDSSSTRVRVIKVNQTWRL